MTGWALSVEERRRATWERRGLVEQVDGSLAAGCRVCGAEEKVYLQLVDVAVDELLRLGWGFEERALRPWLWACPEH